MFYEILNPILYFSSNIALSSSQNDMKFINIPLRSENIEHLSFYNNCAVKTLPKLNSTAGIRELFYKILYVRFMKNIHLSRTI